MVKFNRDVREPRPVEIAGVKRISSSEVICLLWLLYWVNGWMTGRGGISVMILEKFHA